MAKIGRLTGPSNPDGTRPRIVKRTAGVDIEILGADSDLHVAGGLDVDGAIQVASTTGLLTAHDAIHFPVEAMEGSATYVANGSALQAMSYWQFLPSAPSIIKWQWLPSSKGEPWEFYRVWFGWVQLDLVPGPGTVAWKYYESQLTLGGSPVDAYSLVETQVYEVPGGGAGSTWLYSALVARNPTAQGPINTGPFIRSALQRDTDDEGDTHAGASGVGVFLLTATREDER